MKSSLIKMFEPTGPHVSFQPSLSDKELIINLRIFAEIFKSVKVKNMLLNLWYLPWRTRAARNLERKLQELLLFQINNSTEKDDGLAQNMKHLSELCFIVSDHVETDEVIRKKDHKIKLGNIDTLFESLSDIINNIDVEQLLKALASNACLWSELEEKKHITSSAVKVSTGILELKKWIDAVGLLKHPERCGETTHQFLDVAMTTFNDNYFTNGYPYAILDFVKQKNMSSVYVSTSEFTYVVTEKVVDDADKFKRMDQLLLPEVC